MKRGLALRLAGVVAAFAFIALLPRVVSDYRTYQFAFVGIYFIALIGLNILTGYTGQISLGHGAFMMIGAYTTAILNVHHGVRDIWTIPIAGLVAGAAGFAFGFPALRLAGVYLALATFAIPVAMISIAKRFVGFTGGGPGLILHLPKAEFGVKTTPNHWIYYLTWTVAAAMLGLAWLTLRGRTGRALRSIRDSQIAAVSSGVSPYAFKTLAFGLSAFFAGVAGALLAIAAAYVNPDTFPIALSILLLTGVVVGGLGSMVGVVFGALFIEFVPTFFAQQISKQAPSVVYGLILLGVLFLAPGGASALIARGFHLLTKRFYSRPTESPSGRVTSPRSEA